ncbi:MAG: UDP-N-acetylmuramate dehydrogenase [Actinobacteria bacterium]|nr:UDP-N-acetylmuramate dehydrogenase [Actinomycetota bacterium]
MGDDVVAALRAELAPERVHAGAPLSDHTTMRVGGPAAALARVESVAELQAIAGVIRRTGLPWLVIGRGSNLLIADAGWPGIAVILGRGLRGVDVDGTAVRAGAAEPMPALARAVARHGLGGLAFGVAIPGTVGGAVRMNAGAHGREIRDVLVWAEVARMGADGALERWTADRLGFRYRHSDLAADAVVTRVELVLAHTDAERLAAQMAEMRQWRRDNQPINEPSCGSVFRNPDGDSAGRLIEAAGCKGLRVGGAQVSRRHANFVTVTPDARASDVHAIIRTVQRRVYETAGVRLQTEVVLAGFDDDSEGRGRASASRRAGSREDAAGEESAEVWT